jgi:hypothetical protein
VRLTKRGQGDPGARAARGPGQALWSEGRQHGGMTDPQSRYSTLGGEMAPALSRLRASSFARICPPPPPRGLPHRGVREGRRLERQASNSPPSDPSLFLRTLC